ncbi:MAG TPA: sensor histidine kinase [Clostridia bacterium]|nr:sensor histidine kinase [Clostridia bacterium]
MRSRSTYIIALGFGILVTLIGILGIGAVRRAKTIYREMEHTQNTYLRTESFRRDIVSDMYLADILIRDYLLDPSPQNVRSHREQLLVIRASLQERLDKLSAERGQPATPGLMRLQDEVQGYWDSLDPIFDWTPKDKAEMSWGFLRHKVLPRRQAVVSLAREIARANRENLEHEQQRIRDSQQNLRQFLLRMMGFSLCLGVIVAVVTTFRVSILEKEHERQRKQILRTEDDLRRLSHRLVQAQENERKSLSRELHDEVGQTLTALGMELANVETAGRTGLPVLHNRIEEAKRLNSEAMRTVRDLAMGLRPSMLDDLGLEPALQWQGREFARHTGVPASVVVQGDVEALDDARRTCIYRLVQEALTNCARHAEATKVRVSIEQRGSEIEVEVQDNGIGFAPDTAGVPGGLGLIGMKERVQSVGGRLKIASRQGEGTSVLATIPVDGTGGVA